VNDSRRVELRVAVDIFTEDLVELEPDELLDNLQIAHEAMLLVEVEGDKDSTTTFVKCWVEGATLTPTPAPPLPDAMEPRLVGQYADDLAVRLAIVVEDALTNELPSMQLDPAVIDQFCEGLSERFRDAVLNETRGLT